MRSFALYPEEKHWWSFNDYGAVLDVMQELKPTRVLEFGPGSSTLAIIEGGAEAIDTCEDNPEWVDVYRDRLVARFPEVVTLHPYVWARNISIPVVDDRVYDLALIDGPWDPAKRLPALNYALARSAAVLMPVDASKALTNRLEGLSKRGTHRVEIRDTGPLAGAFALIQKADTP